MKNSIIPSPHFNDDIKTRPSHGKYKTHFSCLVFTNLAYGVMCVLYICIGLAQGVEARQPIKLSEPLQKSSQTTNESLDLSWSDVETLSNQLSETLKGSEWMGILAITRGGLFPAGILAHSLNIRRIETINVHSYSAQNTQGEINFLNVPYIPNSGKNWLIVDDLVDSGKTMKAVRKLYPKALSVALVAKPEGLPMVDHHVRKVEQNVWIVFPWEKRTAEER